MPSRTLGRRVFVRSLGILAAIGPDFALGSQTLAGDGSPRHLKGKVIRWIVPHGIGGGFDTYSRLIEPFLERATQAEVVIENVPGAGGLLGARRIMRAAPDGLTLGIVDAPGMLVAMMIGKAKDQVHILDDFTILGRVARSRQIWATGKRSGLRTVDDVIEASARKPIVVGLNEVASTHCFNAVVGAHLLGVDLQLVTGYYGSRVASTAAVRGEVDMVVYTLESILPMIESGDLIPLLQITDKPIGDYPALAGVPLLGGPSGVATRHARETGRNVEEMEQDVQILINMVGAGRLIVAPNGMQPDTLQYLALSLHKALTDPGFKAAAARARRSLDVGGAKEARADLESGAQGVNRFLDIIQAAIQEARQ